MPLFWGAQQYHATFQIHGATLVVFLSANRPASGVLLAALSPDPTPHHHALSLAIHRQSLIKEQLQLQHSWSSTITLLPCPLAAALMS
jgi:hypothetical protein